MVSDSVAGLSLVVRNGRVGLAYFKFRDLYALGSCWLSGRWGRERKREMDRQTEGGRERDRETDRERQTDRGRER